MPRFKLPKGIRRVKVENVKKGMMLATFDAATGKKVQCLTVLSITKDKNSFSRTFAMDDGDDWESYDDDYVYVTKKRF